jgi:hypothetical protein
VTSVFHLLGAEATETIWQQTQKTALDLTLPCLFFLHLVARWCQGNYPTLVRIPPDGFFQISKV